MVKHMQMQVNVTGKSLSNAELQHKAKLSFCFPTESKCLLHPCSQGLEVNLLHLRMAVLLHLAMCVRAPH